MIYPEKLIIEKHCENINDKYEEFAKRIMLEQTPETLSIVYATDVHYIRKYALYVPSYYSLQEMVEFSGYAGIDLFAVTGDLVDGNTTIQKQYRDLYDFLALVRRAKTTAVALSKGNHDDCSWYAFKHKLDSSAWISPEQWYNHVVNPLRVQFPLNLDPENITGGYYYIDYPLQKVRVINLNSNDIVNELNSEGIIDKRDFCGQWCLGFREKQLKWLKNALTFTEEGWSVLLMSHDSPVEYPSQERTPHNSDALWELLTAFKNNRKGHIQKTGDKYFEADFEYDFTANKSNDVLPYLFGHCHRDQVYEKDGIYLVSSRDVLGTNNKNWDDPTSKPEGGWDCMLIDKKKRTFKSRRFEIPEKDREFTF